MLTRPYRCALALALVAGCKAQRHDVVFDSGAAVVDRVASNHSLRGIGVEAHSASAIEPSTIEPAAIQAAAPAPAPANDTSLVIASSDELRELAGALRIPVPGVRADELHDTFNERRGGGSRAHEALDILAPRGTPVLAATDGRLLKLFTSVPGGLMVYEGDSTDRFILMYGHLDRYAAGMRNGQALRRGQVIGYVGTTGDAPADTPHLHFAIARGHPSIQWWRGTPVNPYPLLRNGATIQP